MLYFKLFQISHAYSYSSNNHLSKPDLDLVYHKQQRISQSLSLSRMSQHINLTFYPLCLYLVPALLTQNQKLDSFGLTDMFSISPSVKCGGLSVRAVEFVSFRVG